MKKQTINIAIADDHTMFRKGLVRILNSFKHINIVIEAADGMELLEKLNIAARLPDICVLDIDMRPMNGYDAAKEIRSQYPNIKTVGLSMYNDEFCIIRMLRNGARGYMTKDMEPDKLVVALEQIKVHGFCHQNIDSEILSKAMHTDQGIFPELSEQELMFIMLCCSDLQYKDIALKMHVNDRTIDNYRDKVFKKINVKTRHGLVTLAMLTGLGQRVYKNLAK